MLSGMKNSRAQRSTCSACWSPCGRSVMLVSQMRVLMFMTRLPEDEYGGHAPHDYKFMLLPPRRFVNHVQHVVLACRSPPHDGASFQCVAILHEGAVQALTVRPIRRY